MDDPTIHFEMDRANHLDWREARNRGRYGALEDVLRMPVPQAVVIIVGDFERGTSERGCRELVLVMVAIVVVMLPMLRLDAMMMVVGAVNIPVEMDMEMIAAGMVVEVEPRTRRGDRHHQDHNAESGPLCQSCTHPAHEKRGVPRVARRCHGAGEGWAHPARLPRVPEAQERTPAVVLASWVASLSRR